MDKQDLSKRTTVLRSLGIKSEMLNPNLARTYIPALSFESFGNLGDTMMPWSLLILLNAANILEVWPNLNDTNIYSVMVRLDIDASFYDIRSLKYPLIVDQSIVYVKNTSRCFQYVLRHPESETPYAIKSGVGVNVDPQTRKPKPLPSSWKGRYPSDGPKLAYITPQKPDVGTVITRQYVHHSDIDVNMHTNYTVYAKYCYDAFAENAHQKKYGRDVEYLLKCGLKSLQIQFVKETVLGDVLTVVSWEDMKERNTFHFEVQKGSETCVRVTFHFFARQHVLTNKL